MSLAARNLASYRQARGAINSALTGLFETFYIFAHLPAREGMSTRTGQRLRKKGFCIRQDLKRFIIFNSNFPTPRIDLNLKFY
jgi:hypothetical protein